METEHQRIKRVCREVVLKARATHRPRPLMSIGWHNGRKAYVIKRDITYWQLLEKYPPSHLWFGRPIKHWHALQRHHHMRKSLIQELLEMVKAVLHIS
jgi:hypothetical protein